MRTLYLIAILSMTTCWLPFAEKGADNIKAAAKTQHAHCSYANLVPCPPPSDGGYCCSVCGGGCGLSAK